VPFELHRLWGRAGIRTRVSLFLWKPLVANQKSQNSDFLLQG
jgi:hypothetical protein